jgi:hypothetical protein
VVDIAVQGELHDLHAVLMGSRHRLPGVEASIAKGSNRFQGVPGVPKVLFCGVTQVLGATIL